jgi:16S rRNA (cytosine1402-N4)-methyltransferase
MDGPELRPLTISSIGETSRRTPAVRGAADGRVTRHHHSNGRGNGVFEHRPVMVTEVVDALAPVPAGVLVDATLGGGGHAAALLEAHPQLVLVGLDRDEVALAAAAETLAPFAGRTTLRRARFDQLTTILQELGHADVSAVLFDLGVSSPQLDVADRGFSYRHEGPLDMRQDRRQRRTAADVVNGYPTDELARVLRTYGDERFATRIARAIVAARPLQTTTELAEVVRDAIPAPARRTGGHPAKRTFQAVRIEVNDELSILADSLDQAIDFLAPGGRCAVLAYHSGEDRIVKDRFRHHATGGVEPVPGLPLPPDIEPAVRLVRGVPKTPRAAELAANPRAESARLRVAEKLARRAG